MMTTTFTVSRTNCVHPNPNSNSPKQRLAADRTDLDMASQRVSVANDLCCSFQEALFKEYQATVAPRDTHHHFLRAMLNEVQHFHHRRHHTKVPTQALRSIAQSNDLRMKQQSTDPYVLCLKFMCAKALYSDRFSSDVSLLAIETQYDDQLW